MHRFSTFRILALGVVCGLFLLAVPAAVAGAADCPALPTDKGQLTQKVSVEKTDTYVLWIRQIASPVDRDSVFVRVDDQCPVVAGDNLGQSGFAWTDRLNGEAGKRLLFNLAAGTHTVTVAGREAGEGVDRVLFTSDQSCVPASSADMCAPTTTTAPQGKTTTAAKPVTKHERNWFVLIPCILVGAGALGFMIWKFIRFKPVQIVRSFNVTVGNLPEDAYKGQPKAVQFFAQNKRLVFICGWMMVAAVVFGIVAADIPGQTFEAEGASLSGNAKVADNADASGGKYVVFLDAQGAAVVAKGGKPATATAPSGGSTSSGGGSSGGGQSSGGGSGSGGGSSSGGGGSTPASCTGNKHTPGGSDGMNGCWPGPSNTGVPAGTVLSAYTGSCTITANNTTIDSKTINCDLVIQASGVKITKSKINGSVSNDENTTGHSFTISDTEIDVGNRAGTGLESRDFTATRMHIYGGNRSVNCWDNCSITDSYVHGQFRDNSGVAHESGIRMGQSSTIRHNSILCDAPEVPPDAGCSADLTGYGDFGPVQNNVIDKNLFMATLSGGFCSYGGSSQGKPYSGQTNHITFTDNIYQRGTNPSDHGQYVCGYYGSNTAFDPNAPGNVWSNNKFDDGTTVSSQN